MDNPIPKSEVVKKFFLDKKIEKFEKLRAEQQTQVKKQVQGHMILENIVINSNKSKDGLDPHIDNKRNELPNFNQSSVQTSKKVSNLNQSSFIGDKLKNHKSTDNSTISLENLISSDKSPSRNSSPKNISMENSPKESSHILGIKISPLIRSSKKRFVHNKIRKEARALSPIDDNEIENALTENFITEINLNIKVNDTPNKDVQEESSLLRIDSEILRNSVLYKRKKTKTIEPAMRNIFPSSPIVLKQQLIFCKKTGLIK